MYVQKSIKTSKKINETHVSINEDCRTINENCGTIMKKSKPLKWQLPAPKCCRFHENDAKTMDKERFEVQNAANTVEIAAFRVKMLQIARKMDRTVNPKNNPQTEKNKSPNNSRPYIFYHYKDEFSINTSSSGPSQFLCSGYLTKHWTITAFWIMFES